MWGVAGAGGEHDAVVGRENDFGPTVDFLAVRTQLEAFAARLAAPRIDERPLEELVVIHDRFRRAVDSGDQDGARRADSDFHHAIQDLAGNECLAESLERVGTQVVLGAYATAWVTSRGPAVLEHERVLRALEDQDGQAAETAMIRHLDNLTTRITREWRAQDTAEDATPERSEHASSFRRRNVGSWTSCDSASRAGNVPSRV